MFIGREYELKQLNEMKKSSRAELVVVYGRRRVGKSALLEQIIQGSEDYFFEAVKGLTKKKQISHFLKQLEEMTRTKTTIASSWQEAFDQLTPHIESGAHTLIFDEFPWMASEKIELVSILKYYWDRKWKKNNELKLVLCGSVANYMIKHLIHSEALHNRKTLEMKIDPLSANEAKLFFKNKRSLFEICKFLMIFGGIPKYLEQINPNLSFEQNLDKLCFMKNSFFTNEFETVFKEQFKTIKKYEPIVQILSAGKKTKEDLQTQTQSTRGGGFGTLLHQLEMAGFISKEISLNFEVGRRKSRTQKYTLWDEWLKFYLTYMKKNSRLIQNQTSGGLSGRLIGNSLPSYLGLFFETFCQKNITQIIKSLNIEPATIIDIGPYFRQSSKNKEGKPLNKKNQGLQLDLCIVRKGRIITAIECKFKESSVGTDVIKEMDDKIAKLNLAKNITLERVLISASGVTPEVEASDYFHRILGLEAIFN